MVFIHNDVVADILTMEDCIAAQEAAFRELAEGRAAHRPRSDIYAPCERDDGQITFYHNIGNQGLQFSSVCALVYRKAKEKGMWSEIPTEWFLQDIRD